MRHRKKKFTLDRTSAARRALLRNLAASTILYERITTTDARARAVRQIVERLVSIGKDNSLANRRRLLAYLPVRKATNKVLEVLSPRYRQRPGGYLRMTKLGRQRSDGATLVRLEFVA